MKENQVNPEKDDFFELEISKEHNEIEEFLHSKDSSLTMLKSFPSIKEIFCQYNTVSPSSAPVERLFSRGSLVFGQKRLRLLDSNFEKHLMVNANQKIFLENKL